MESASRHRASYKFPCSSSRSTHQAHLSLSSQTVQRQCYCARGVQSAGAESICERQAKAAMECPVAAARDGLAPRQLPPGFRFHPTDQELVVQYLRRKALSRPLPAAVIPVVHDVARLDPWDFPGAREGEAYFFSLQRVPVTGGGRRRSARSGYWKATRKAKPVFLQGSGCGGNRYLVGVKTALAFHRDEPSRASRTAWVMHEYRLAVPGGVAEQRKHATQGCAAHPGGEWIVCRVFLKNSPRRRPNRDAAGDTSGNFASAARPRDQLRLMLSSSPPGASPSSCVTGVTEISDQDEVDSGSSVRDAPSSSRRRLLGMLNSQVFPGTTM